jgi:mRNA-degrading endonuclease YafQ of YafQ-DinJ toxin-antitoxin module
MPFALLFTEQYNRRAAKFLKQHPELRSTYLKTLQLLEANPAHPSLRLHALRGKFDGLHSVELLIQDQQIIPVNVGDHDAVY